MVSQLSHFCLGLVEDSLFLLFLLFLLLAYLRILKGRLSRKKKNKNKNSTVQYFFITIKRWQRFLLKSIRSLSLQSLFDPCEILRPDLFVVNRHFRSCTDVILSIGKLTESSRARIESQYCCFINRGIKSHIYLKQQKVNLYHVTKFSP